MNVFPGEAERMNRMNTTSKGGKKPQNKAAVECLYSDIPYIQTWSLTEMPSDSKTSQDNKKEWKIIQFSHQKASKISFAFSI